VTVEDLTSFVLLLFCRLQQRGGRTLKERTRATQIEGRLGDVGKEISKLRRDLSSKPN
jgi:hypothetical protein